MYKMKKCCNMYLIGYVKYTFKNAELSYLLNKLYKFSVHKISTISLTLLTVEYNRLIHLPDGL